MLIPAYFNSFITKNVVSRKNMKIQSLVNISL